jgi:GT2 family glycosyltransferase
MKRILIAVPCGAPCEMDAMKSIYDLDIPDNVKTELRFVSGYSVSDARNKLAHESVDNGYDYTLFVDGDVVLPRQLLTKLLCLESDIASGWYPKKQFGGVVPEIYTHNLERNCYEPITEILEYEYPRVIGIDGAGFGCVLIKNSVFEKVQLADGRYFEYVYYDNGHVLSEDLSFCNRAKQAGCNILADTELRCGHIGKIHF